MAVGAQALSPWPVSPVALANVIARLRAAVAGRADESDEAACALGAMAAARVELEAPGAPQPVKDEATIRYSGYLSSADFGSVRKEDIGPMAIEYATNHANAWRNCGAAGLVAPWRIRRAGVIG